MKTNMSLLGQAVQFIFWMLVRRGFPATSVVVKLFFFQVITISVKSEAIYTTDENGTAPLEEVGSVFLPPGQQPWGCLGKAGWNTALYHTMTVSWQSLAQWLLDWVDTVKFQKWCLSVSEGWARYHLYGYHLILTNLWSLSHHHWKFEIIFVAIDMWPFSSTIKQLHISWSPTICR